MANCSIKLLNLSLQTQCQSHFFKMGDLRILIVFNRFLFCNIHKLPRIKFQIFWVWYKLLVYIYVHIKSGIDYKEVLYNKYNNNFVYTHV